MDCRTEIETDRDVLKRVVTVLLALADLADRLCSLPRPVRCLVLWILRPAENAARQFVVGLTVGAEKLPPACEIPAPLVVEAGPADAARLALSFRELAQTLDDLEGQARRSSRCRTHRDAKGAPGGRKRDRLAQDSSRWQPSEMHEVLHNRQRCDTS